MRQEFIKFIARGNVIDLAVGIIIGASFTAIVNSLVNDIIMPPIGVILGGVDFSNIFVTLSSGGPYASLAAAQQAGAATLNIELEQVGRIGPEILAADRFDPGRHAPIGIGDRDAHGFHAKVEADQRATRRPMGGGFDERGDERGHKAA